VSAALTHLSPTRPRSPDILDPALVRPGRFDSTVDVSLPDVRGRREIIDLYLSRVVVAPASGIDSQLLARATPGFSGAQLEALVNSAALMAANRGSEYIEMRDVEEARDKLIMGPAKKSRVRNPAQSRLTAYHEGGHTLAAVLTPATNPLHKVTILPRGFSGGATYSLPKDDELQTKESILAQIDVCMGGRAAEELIYGPDKVTVGAGMDMQQATSLAQQFCMNLSMSKLGLTSFKDKGDPSPDAKAAIDAEVEAILQASYARVLALLTAQRGKLDRLATALIEYETLDAEEVKAVLEGKALASLRERAGLSQTESAKKGRSGGGRVLPVEGAAARTPAPAPAKAGAWHSAAAEAGAAQLAAAVVALVGAWGGSRRDAGSAEAEAGRLMVVVAAPLPLPEHELHGVDKSPAAPRAGPGCDSGVQLR
jgi:hypothetical protein